jgi:adenine deaminase
MKGYEMKFELLIRNATVIDGHAPGLSGPALAAYIAAGPCSDHECTTAAEATEKLRAGMMVFLREATNACNLRDLVPALTAASSRRVALCTDDRQPPDLLDEGGIDHMIRALVQEGVAPMEAIRLATLNPAEYFGLRDRGAIAPGRRADLVAFASLERPEIEWVMASGRAVAENGRPVGWTPPAAVPSLPPSIRVDWNAVQFVIPAPSTSSRLPDVQARVIRVIPDQIVGKNLIDALRFAPWCRNFSDDIKADLLRRLSLIFVNTDPHGHDEFAQKDPQGSSAGRRCRHPSARPLSVRTSSAVPSPPISACGAVPAPPVTPVMNEACRKSDALGVRLYVSNHPYCSSRASGR